MTAIGDYAACADLLRFVSRCTGLALPVSRWPFIAAGIGRAMAAAHAATIGDYLDLLSRSESALDGLIAEVTVGETFFFRDPGHLEFIRQEVLPEIRRRRGRDHVLRAWSAGCASGEEAYSLAILFEEAGIAAQSHIFATDISRPALAKARRGVYGPWSLRSAQPGFVERYFRREGTGFVLADRIRRSVAFDYLNLAIAHDRPHRAGTAETDVILCRNVLIYLEPERIPVVAANLFASLSPGGWLVTGPSDPLLSDHAPFEVALTSAGLLYRRRASLPASTSTWSAADHAEVSAPHSDVSTEDASPAPEPAPQVPENSSSLARMAFARGDYAEALRLLPDPPCDIESVELRILSLANRGLVADAERSAAASIGHEPLDAKRHLLHAMTLMALRRYDDGIAAARRAVYLDPDSPRAYLLLGAMLECIGAAAEAERAFRNGRALASARSDDAVTPDSVVDGATIVEATAEPSLAYRHGNGTRP